jgi:hypothetical protein
VAGQNKLPADLPVKGSREDEEVGGIVPSSHSPAALSFLFPAEPMGNKRWVRILGTSVLWLSYLDYNVDFFFFLYLIILALQNSKIWHFRSLMIQVKEECIRRYMFNR